MCTELSSHLLDIAKLLSRVLIQTYTGCEGFLFPTTPPKLGVFSRFSIFPNLNVKGHHILICLSSPILSNTLCFNVMLEVSS